MPKIDYIGTVPNICSNFPKDTELPLPENAYLPLTLEQLIFIHWRVKRWEISYEFSSKSISQLVTIGGGTFLQFEFSHPSKSVAYQRSGPHIQSVGVNANERNLICNFNRLIDSIGFGLSGADLPLFTGSQSLSISSTESQTFDPPDGEEPFNFNHSRGSYGETLFAYSPNFSAARKIDTTYYMPYTVGILLDITNSTTDNLLFDEQSQKDTIEQGSTMDGAQPPIGGFLTTNPEGSYSSSAYKATIQISEEESNTIEMDLFDKTEPSAITSTRFNVDGFNGIKIKPIEYWTYS